MLVLHGALPSLLMPTLLQAAWSVGFSQSFANQFLWSVYATNFGAPEPAAMAFGLPGAWLAGLYIRLGLPPPDAYSAMVASWMTLAMAAAYATARHYSVRPAHAVLAALSWMSMPVTWAHADYSMLSIGIALLPMYVLFTLKLLQQCAPADGEPRGNANWWTLAYPVVCILAVFMDGYSFMFFASGSSLIAGWWWLKADPVGRKRLILVALPLHVFSLAAAYVLYVVFVGQSGFSAASLDFLRGWGADLTFFVRPTHGVHWLPDLLGWSMVRAERQHFGDASVWVTTFAIPVVLSGLWAAWRVNHTQTSVVGLLVVASFGFYMALGPSIKLNSVKPEGTSAERLMPAEAALAPTGSAILSERLPGFNNMRASYRWTALGVFGAWSLLLLSLSARSPRNTRSLAAALLIGVTLFNVPNLQKKWSEDAKNRSIFLQIEADLVEKMRRTLRPKERVAFLPYRNDFLVNYLSARLDIVSFNIGGDKNLESARQHWPRWMAGFTLGEIDHDFAVRVALLLAEKEADAVVLPYFDMQGTVRFWPKDHSFQQALEPVVAFFKKSPLFEVTNSGDYAVVRLKDEFREVAAHTLMEQVLRIQHTGLIDQRATASLADSMTTHSILVSGWSGAESWGRWSDSETAKVLLSSVPSTNRDIELVVRGRAFLVPKKLDRRQINVFVDDRYIGQLNYLLPHDTRDSIKTITVPRELLTSPSGEPKGLIWITFQFNESASPAQLGLSSDQRKIALGLSSLYLREKR